MVNIVIHHQEETSDGIRQKIDLSTSAVPVELVLPKFKINIVLDG